jgi:hypothetical protein
MITAGYVLPLGSAGYQPAAFGRCAECTFIQCATHNSLKFKSNVRGKLPRTTGQRPVLPRRGNGAL